MGWPKNPREKTLAFPVLTEEHPHEWRLLLDTDVSDELPHTQAALVPVPTAQPVAATAPVTTRTGTLADLPRFHKKRATVDPGSSRESPNESAQSTASDTGGRLKLRKKIGGAGSQASVVSPNNTGDTAPKRGPPVAWKMKQAAKKAAADPKQASLTFVATGKISMAIEKETIADGTTATTASTDSDDDFQ